MQTESAKINLERANVIRHIIKQLRARASVPKECDAVLNDLKVLAGPGRLARELLSSPNRRANLKRVAFPGRGVDLDALNAAIEAGNPLPALDCLAGPTAFDFEGRMFHAHVRPGPKGCYMKAKNGTLRVLYSTTRLTADDKDYLRQL
jgi:hypothetical protein